MVWTNVDWLVTIFDIKLLKQLKNGQKFWMCNSENLAFYLVDCATLRWQSLVSDCNLGNFLELWKCLAKFDPVLRECLIQLSGKLGCLTHFAADIQNKLINLLEARVWETIISSIEKANYYSTIFAIMPDSLHNIAGKVQHLKRTKLKSVSGIWTGHCP